MASTEELLFHLSEKIDIIQVRHMPITVFRVHFVCIESGMVSNRGDWNRSASWVLLSKYFPGYAGILSVMPDCFPCI